MPAPTPRSRPYGIMINAKGAPVFCLFGTNKLATIDPKTMEIKEYTLPNAASRPRRIAIVGDEVWYSDFSRCRRRRRPAARRACRSRRRPGGRAPRRRR